ncbi:MAG: glutaredoxin family protein [Candidatus Micrarchaeia archaeon]|jgi:glutaredoxin-like YruB-family protein
MADEKKTTKGAEKKIIVYGTETCPYCVMAKKYFDSKKVKYEDVNLNQQRDRVYEIIAKSGQTGVPVIDINGKIIVGFDRAAIDAALEA